MCVCSLRSSLHSVRLGIAKHMALYYWSNFRCTLSFILIMRLYAYRNTCPKRTKGSEGLTTNQTNTQVNQVKCQPRDFRNFIYR